MAASTSFVQCVESAEEAYVRGSDEGYEEGYEKGYEEGLADHSN